MITVVVMLVLLVGATFIVNEPVRSPSSPRQCGYTIIEAGKALDCRGDTIAVERVHPEILALANSR